MQAGFGLFLSTGATVGYPARDAAPTWYSTYCTRNVNIRRILWRYSSNLTEEEASNSVWMVPMTAKACLENYVKNKQVPCETNTSMPSTVSLFIFFSTGAVIGVHGTKCDASRCQVIHGVRTCSCVSHPTRRLTRRAIQWLEQLQSTAKQLRRCEKGKT